MFVAAGSSIWTSPDGINWTSRWTMTPGYSVGVIYGNNTFVVSGDWCVILSSTDGITWTNRTNSTTSSNGACGAYYEDNIILAWNGDNGTILTSMDWLNWTKTTTENAIGLQGITFADNTFVGGGTNGIIHTSPDGVTWTNRPTGVSDTLYSVVYGNNTFVAVGANGTIIQSDPVITTPSPNIAVSPTSHDFGSIPIGASAVTQTFTVSNTGNAGLVIGTLSFTSASADFARQNDNCSGQTLLPIGTCTVQMVFTPSSTGAKSATLSIPSNDTDTPTLNISLSGTGTDTTPPDTTITSQPANPSKSNSGDFSFTSTEAGSSFQCKVDSNNYATCTSPASYTGLAEGSHTFSVKATDGAGNTDPTPAGYTWTIDTSAPVTALTGSPSNPSKESTASFTFSSSETGSTFRCQLDSGSYTSCTSPVSYTGLVDGAHSFAVKATDGAGNTDATPAVYAWTIDTKPPTGDDIQLLPRTGQSVSFTAGDDGDKEAGLAWPVPRFIDHGDGTVTDKLTGLVWTRNAGTPTLGTCSGGKKSWQSALSYVACLNSNSYLGYADWHLPNRVELESLINAGAGSSAVWLNTQGFSNVKADNYYWSSTTYINNTNAAWYVDLAEGLQNGTSKSTSYYVWPVRIGSGGSVGDGMIILPQTGQSVNYAAGDDGEIQAGLTWPVPRFTNNITGMMKDRLTGLIWTKDESTPDAGVCTGGVKTWPEAFNFINCLNATGYLGYTDWRLPNKNELASLTNMDETNSAAWLQAQGFANAKADIYWSSSTSSSATDFAWSLDLWYGSTDTLIKTDRYYVWPVRSGQNGVFGNPGISINGGADFTRSTAVNLTLAASDANGVALMAFSSDGTTWLAAESYATAKSWTLSSGEGVKTVYVKFQDSIGNWSSPYNASITLDTTAPVTIATPAGGLYPATQIITLQSSESASIYYTTDGTIPTTDSTVYTGAIDMAATTTLKFLAVDQAGNKEKVKTENYTIDLVSPDTTITDKPPHPTNGTTANFSFSSSKSGSTFQCQLDSGSYTTCTSPASYQGLSEGSHTFSVKARDAVGNFDPTPAVYTWTIDLTVPLTTAAPATGVYGTNQSVTLTTSESASIYYTIDETTPTVTSTVYATPINISSTTTLKFFARDLAGNQESVRTEVYTINTAAPVGTITINGGAPLTNSQTVTLTLAASDTDGLAQMQFSNDNATWSEPEVFAPTKIWTLSSGEGLKTVYVKYQDTAGNWSAAYSSSINLDMTPPVTTINSRPANPSNTNAPNFTFSSTESGVSFQCALDSGNFTPCASPAGYTGQTEGTHTFAVKGTDAAGNTNPTPTGYTWQVDTIAPETSIVSKPGSTSNSKSANFTFASTETMVSYQCALDNGNFAPCTSPVSFSALAEGTHTFAVKATDAAGNTDATAAEYTWRIDTTPPVTTAAPGGGLYNATKTVTLQTGEPATIYYTTDGSTPTENSPVYTTSLTIGVSMTLKFFAKDTAGNMEGIKSEIYSIDQTPPSGSITINGAAAYTNKTDVVLTLSATDANGVAQMQLGHDGVNWSAVESYVPSKTWILTDGEGLKTVYVQYQDSAGNWSGTFSVWITLDTTPPETTITVFPSNPSNTNNPSFSFTSTETGVSFQCAMDSGNFATCISPVSYSGLTDGLHTFTVKATDAAGNTDTTPAGYTWTIVTLGPDTIITGQPDNPSNIREAVFSFSSNKEGATFQCLLDSGNVFSCTSPTTYPDLADGSHNFSVKAIDLAGNQDSTPAGYDWTIDTVAPQGIDMQVLARTGQTVSFQAGDDGDKEAGMAWPAPRFADNSDGTVTDKLTGLIWTRNAGVPTFGACTGGKKSWSSALSYLACLNTNSYLGYSDWRLPNRLELDSLMHLGESSPITWLTGQGFSNVQSNNYWSATTYAASTNSAWFVSMIDGIENGATKSSSYFIWPVRAGQTALTGAGMVALAGTGQTTTYAAGDDGKIQAGAVWPIPRFLDDGDGTVRDRLTGLSWASESDSASVGSCTGGSKSWNESFDFINCLNAAGYLGYGDWRLPNKNELASLINLGEANPAVWLNSQGFTKARGETYWSSTTSAGGGASDYAWSINMWDGKADTMMKADSYYVWPVRSGQNGLLGSLGISINGGADDTRSATVTLRLAASDANGLYRMQLRENEADWLAAETYVATRAWTLSSGEGLKTVSARFQDRAGNWSEPYSASITLDTTAPVTTASPSGGLYATPQRVSLQTQNSDVAVIFYTADGADPTPQSPIYSGDLNIQSSTVLKFQAVDRAGNKEQIRTENYLIDTLPPETSLTSKPSLVDKSTEAHFSFTSLETGISFQCSLDGGNYLLCTSPVSYPGLSEGDHTFYIKATDAAGNTEQTPESYTWKIDVTAPATTATPPGGLYNTNQSVQLSASEPATIYYTTDGTDPSETSLVYFGQINISTTTTLKFRAKDSAGNLEIARREDYVINTTAPVGTITVNNGATHAGSQEVTLTLSATDSDGVDQMQFKNENESWSNPEPYGILKAWSLSEGDGTKTVYVKYSDKAGNWSGAFSYTITLDTAAPDTTIVGGPSSLTNSTAATFSFTSPEGGVSFLCKVDSGNFTPCTSPASYTGLVEGPHTFAVRATDLAGNSDPTPATHSWVVDTTAPDTTINAKPVNPSGSHAADFSFTLTEAEGSFQCKMDGGEFANCLNPASYTGLADGSHTFWVKATDLAGNTDATPAGYTWVVDTTLPVTTATPAGGLYNNTQSVTLKANETATIYYTTDGSTPTASSPVYVDALDITSTMFLNFLARDSAGNVEAVKTENYTIDKTAPTGTIAINSGALYTNKGEVTLTLSASDANGIARMQLNNDGATWSNPEDYAATKTWMLSAGDGVKTVSSKFQDNAGNWSVAVSAAITLDTLPPHTTIIGHPDALTNSKAPSFNFNSTDGGVSFQCQIDSGSFLVCESPAGYSGLADGLHTLSVKATDAAGNVEANPASYSWTIDTTPPDTTIADKPQLLTNLTEATFSFNSTESGSSFQCQLDEDGFTACPSPVTHASLAEGSHTFSVKATDAAGNTDPSPAIYTWTIDVTVPDNLITGKPETPTNNTAAEFTFIALATENATFECQLDNGGFKVCISPKSYPSLKEGTRTFEVRAIDAAGNADPTPATFTWVIDVVPPDTTIEEKPADLSKASSATFSFSSSKTGSRFECQLDNGVFTACTSPATFGNLSEGVHIFSVKATDPAGNTDPSPATNSWTIDLIPPVTSATPKGGTYTGGQNVTLAAIGEAADIYYTTDGTTPDITSNIYSPGTPIPISKTAVLKFFGLDRAGNMEPVQTETYIIKYNLAVSKTGTGTGVVESSPTGVNCGADCSEPYESGTAVTLTATQNPGSIFKGWVGGGCSGTGQCTVKMEGGRTVTAVFGGVTETPTSVSGLIGANTTWTLAKSPYNVTGNIVVKSGVTLTIEPGVIIKFNAGWWIQVDGTLLARGTEAAAITFTSNLAGPKAGDWAYLFFSDASSEAVFDESGNYVSGSILEYVIVQYGGGATGNDNGAVRMNNAHPFINHCTISNNKASGLYAWNLTDLSKTLRIENSLIMNNKATRGAGIYLSGGPVYIGQNTVENNQATGEGGGIFLLLPNDPGYHAMITNNDLIGNTASAGGGIYGLGGDATVSFEISQNRIRNNVSSGRGGGVYAMNGVRLIIGNMIDNNRAETGQGGGLFIDGQGLTIARNIISNNTAALQGGGISFNEAAGSGFGVEVINNTIYHNTAKDGAAVYYLKSTDKDFRSNTVTENRATDLTGYTSALFVTNWPLINHNNFYMNATDYQLFNNKPTGSPELDARDNWWGDKDFDHWFYDASHDATGTKGWVSYDPPAPGIHPDTPISPPTGLKAVISTDNITVSWTQNVEDDVAGYKVYWSTDGRNYSNVEDVGNITSFIITDLILGKYYIGVTAYDAEAALVPDDPASLVNEAQTEGHESWYASLITASIYPLSVTREGSGAGKVMSLPAGIDCGSDCEESYSHGTTVTLTAYPDANSGFTGWSGACSGTASECSFLMDQEKAVTATFSDIVAPSGTILINGGADRTNNPNVTLTLSAGDPYICAIWQI